MKKALFCLSIFLLAVMVNLAPTLAFATSEASGETTTRTCSTTGPFGIPTWFRGLVDDNCEVQWPSGSGNSEHGLDRFITIILINISDMITRIIGLVAVGFIIFGGFKYMLAQGDPNKVASAKKTIANAIIGLVIAMLAVVLVNFVFNIFR